MPCFVVALPLTIGLRDVAGGVKWSLGLATTDHDDALRNALSRVFHNDMSFSEWLRWAEQKLILFLDAHCRPLSAGEEPPTAKGALLACLGGGERGVCACMTHHCGGSHSLLVAPAAKATALAAFKTSLGTVFRGCLFHTVNALMVHVLKTGKGYSHLTSSCASRPAPYATWARGASSMARCGAWRRCAAQGACS